MAEFRTDSASDEWVILSTKQAKRPQDFVQEEHALDASSSPRPRR